MEEPEHGNPLAHLSSDVRLAVSETERRISDAMALIKIDMTKTQGDVLRLADGQRHLGEVVNETKETVKELSAQVRALWWKMGIVVGAASGISWAITHLSK